jgi:natural product precursor
MKKIKLNGKISLNKETIAKLNDDQMNDVKGGRFTAFLSLGKRCRGAKPVKVSKP